MHSLIWHTLTFGIPLLGVAICIAAGVLVYRWARLHRISRMLAGATYFITTLLPLVFARAVIGLGDYLGSRYQIDVFGGEDVWALGVFMVYYSIVAVVFNLLMWFLLYCEIDEQRC